MISRQARTFKKVHALAWLAQPVETALNNKGSFYRRARESTGEQSIKPTASHDMAHCLGSPSPRNPGSQPPPPALILLLLVHARGISRVGGTEDMAVRTCDSHCCPVQHRDLLDAYGPVFRSVRGSRAFPPAPSSVSLPRLPSRCHASQPRASSISQSPGRKAG